MSYKIVITGASGFLGRHIVERIKDRQTHKVFALSSHPDELRETIGGRNVEYHHKNAIFRSQANEIIERAIIVNCAYPRNTTGSEIADGLKYIQRVFESAVNNRATAIINISSQSVYSQYRSEIASEETPVCLESPYAVGKYAVELMLESICKGNNTNYTSLRMASLIGPGFDQRVVNRLVKQAFTGEVLHVVSSDQRFGFLDVEDAVSAIISIIEKDPVCWKPVYTIGNGEEYSLIDIANIIMQSFIEMGIPFPGMEIEYEKKTCRTGVGYQLINKDTGFTPEYSLKDTVYRILSGLGV